MEAKKRADKQVKQEKIQIKNDENASLNSLYERIAALKIQLKQTSKTDAFYKKNLDDIRKLKKEVKEVKEQFRRKFKVTRKEAYEKAIQIMKEVNIPEPRKDSINTHSSYLVACDKGCHCDCFNG